MMRTTFLFAFLFALAHSQIFDPTLRLGVRKSGDHALQRLHLTTPQPGPNQRLGPVDKLQVLSGQDGAIITQMVIDDRSPERCATTAPINGGPGSSFAVLRIQSPENCMIDLMIDLYGM